MTGGLEIHEEAAEGHVEDEIPPRRALSFEWDVETSAALDPSFEDGVGQVVIYMRPSGVKPQPVEVGNDCLTLRIDEVVPMIRWLVDAYASRLERTMWDLAAGGCRTCRNRRWVWAFGDRRGCPTCSPRAEKRIRDRLWFRNWRR